MTTPTTVFFIPCKLYDLSTIKRVRDAAAVSPLRLVFPSSSNNPQPEPPMAA